MPGRLIRYAREGIIYRKLRDQLIGHVLHPAADLSNLLRHGSVAPRYAERIWVNPLHCQNIISGIPNIHRLSGKIIDDSWPPYREREERIVPAHSITVVRCCLEHWSEGVPWESTGAYERMQELIQRYGSFNGCRTLDDIAARYRKLDQVFDQIRRDGRIKTRQELDRKAFRERGGIIVHVGKEGDLYFGQVGNHRFAMALALGLPVIPAQLGFVHKAGIEHLRSLRIPPN